MPSYKLTYFNTSGFGDPIRYLFHLAGVPFEDNRIPLNAERSLPKEIKENAPWGQVPLLHVDGKVIAQSSAIFRFLAQEFGYTGKSNFESAKCDEFVDGAKDFLYSCFPIMGEKDEVKKAEMIKEIDNVKAPEFLGRLTKILQENGGEWLVGDKISWADLYIVNFIEIYDSVYAKRDVLGEFPALKKYFLKVLALPAIDKYRKEHPSTDPLMKRKY